MRRTIDTLTDEELFNSAQILGNVSHLSRESVIAQAKELLTTNRIYTAQTNISGKAWLKLASYLVSINVSLDAL